MEACAWIVEARPCSMLVPSLLAPLDHVVCPSPARRQAPARASDSRSLWVARRAGPRPEKTREQGHQLAGRARVFVKPSRAEEGHLQRFLHSRRNRHEWGRFVHPPACILVRCNCENSRKSGRIQFGDDALNFGFPSLAVLSMKCSDGFPVEAWRTQRPAGRGRPGL